MGGENLPRRGRRRAVFGAGTIIVAAKQDPACFRVTVFNNRRHKRSAATTLKDGKRLPAFGKTDPKMLARHRTPMTRIMAPMNLVVVQDIAGLPVFGGRLICGGFAGGAKKPHQCLDGLDYDFFHFMSYFVLFVVLDIPADVCYISRASCIGGVHTRRDLVDRGQIFIRAFHKFFSSMVMISTGGIAKHCAREWLSRWLITARYFNGERR